LSAQPNAYDAVAYPTHPFAHTHPSNLAAMAILHGLEPAPVERCRVLEVACNEGSNLIPMAYAIPGSEFVGFDLAGSPIERGQERIRELGLKNIRLFQADLLDVGAELGKFDYIIAHGLYAWAPEPVRDKLLALCGDILTPNGVAFISYNALPGGYIRKLIREFMVDRVSGENLDAQLADSLRLLKSLIEVRPEGDAFRVLVEEQLKRLRERSPRLIFHDELSEAHYPLYFTEFETHARSHGLQYLTEAALPKPNDPCYRADLRAALDKEAPGDLVKQEQMLDYARMRVYRETLLCRAGLRLRRDYAPADFRRLLFASPAHVAFGEAAGAMVFSLPDGIRMETNHPAVCALLSHLQQAWPRALKWDEIEPVLALAGFTLNAEGVALLMRLAVTTLLELQAWRAPVAAEASDRPRASACSRIEARTQAQATTLLHSVVQLEDAQSRRFMQLLDGTRDRRELLAAMQAEFPEMSGDIEATVDPILAFFYRAGFLEA
jgi:SAM-dependent methyltransferase